MGNRISIAFKNGDEESVTLFSHWGGLDFKKTAKEYLKELKEWCNRNNGSTPLSRMEPNTVMVDFIRSYTKNMERVDGDLYLAKDKHDGDDSDNGHHTINLNS